MESVPCVTTTAAMLGSAACSAIAASSVSNSASPIDDESSCNVSRMRKRGVNKLVAADCGHEGAGVVGSARDGASGADDGDVASHEFKYKRQAGKISSSATTSNQKPVGSRAMTPMSILED